MNSLKKNILEKINKGDVKKKPKLYFLTKKYTLWISAGMSVFLGAISFSILLKNTFDDFGPWYKIKLENSFFLSNILYIWMGSFIFFLGTFYLNYINTKNAFKYRKIYIILWGLLASLILGGIFYLTHTSNFIDKKFENNFHQYKEIKYKRREVIIKELHRRDLDTEEFFKNKHLLKNKERN